MSIENFRQLADYNHWANCRLYEAALKMSEEQYRRPIGVYFGSLHGTLNHLLLTDRVWLTRLDREGELPSRLDEILFEKRDELALARMTDDRRLKRLVASYRDDDLGTVMSYQTLAGQLQSQTLEEILLHLFNHQAHHRGQAHACCSVVTGEGPPSLDFILFQRGVPAPNIVL